VSRTDPISSVLVANRGEIALRVFRTCRTLGLRTVAVFSDADDDAPHTRAADLAVHLPGTAAADTYLRAERIIDAAHRAGANAIHPGYGFLSENAGFARAVAAAGLTWIGPSPEAIEAMGDKVESKRLMARAGVPVQPELDPEQVTAAQLPVMIKASAGGGGRGIRVVHDLSELPRQVELARAEARSAFGDPTVFCERFLAGAHHVEVQVMADQHGTVWAVGERECSVQRRHQKIIEESPSPLVERTPGLRGRLLETARAAAAAVGYTGAGTVEFLADGGDRGDFYFLEMNTRLQVEHPVTECVTGLDLVELQLLVADGHRLADTPPPSRGHAVEARLYAEDPAHDWRPGTGALHAFSVPGVSVCFTAGTQPSGIRLDSGVADGSEVSSHYDPLLAKVISWAPDRARAVRTLADALRRATVHGPVTNRDLLVNILGHQRFRAGDTSTDFLDRAGLAELATAHRDDRLCALAAALAVDAGYAREARVHGDLVSGWRNVVSQPQYVELEDSSGTAFPVGYRFDRAGLVVADMPPVRAVHIAPDRVVLQRDGLRIAFAVSRYGDRLFVDSAAGCQRFVLRERLPDRAEAAAPGSLTAPMPGVVVRVEVEPGQVVVTGQPVLLLEAMKMQHPVTAPTDGTVTELHVGPGDQVANGTVLAVIDPHGPR
jgi:propionyl-CoA carboxylase alpha chain